MSQTLGEKLRQAREERGVSIVEVAEQTRISAHYLDSIENDDYRTLPGGIFNKGFIKSYSKFVGLDEQEALNDYAALMSQGEIDDEPKLKLYKPEVLTDDRGIRSMIPTVIGAVVILGLMTVGILYGLEYWKGRNDTTAKTPPVNTNSNSTSGGPATNGGTTAGGADMSTVKVEFKTTTQAVRLVAVSDGVKSDNLVAPGSSKSFEPKDSLTLDYNRWNSNVVQLTINGKPIALPSVPLEPKSQRIAFTITKDNLPRILESGAISKDVPATQTETATGPQTPPDTSVPTAPASTPAKTTSTPKPSPAATSTPKAATNIKVNPTPKGTVIPVKPSNTH